MNKVERREKARLYRLSHKDVIRRYNLRRRLEVRVFREELFREVLRSPRGWLRGRLKARRGKF